MKSLKEYLHFLVSRGSYFFTKQEALVALGLNPIQFQLQAYRLSKKRMLRRLVKDFYMIVPAEYDAMGSLPPDWLIDPLMKYLNQDYYIGLLSAASLYGATHYQPMRFQVITTKPLRTISLPRGDMYFYVNADYDSSAITQITPPTGWANISTKEQTLIDLVKYYKVAGHLDNVALVIKELSPECNSRELQKIVSRERKQAPLQRLGYILDQVSSKELAAVVKKELEKRNITYRLLNPDAVKKFGRKNKKWFLILNDKLDIS